MNTVKCKKCPKEIIFLLSRNNKPVPVNPESLSEADLHELNHGYRVIFDPSKHVSHFVTCQHAAEFRKPKTQPVKSFFDKDGGE